MIFVFRPKTYRLRSLSLTVNLRCRLMNLIHCFYSLRYKATAKAWSCGCHMIKSFIMFMFVVYKDSMMNLNYLRTHLKSINLVVNRVWVKMAFLSLEFFVFSSLFQFLLCLGVLSLHLIFVCDRSFSSCHPADWNYFSVVCLKYYTPA